MPAVHIQISIEDSSRRLPRTINSSSPTAQPHPMKILVYMAFSGADLRSGLPVAGQLVQGQSTGRLEVRDVALGDLYLRTHFLNLSVDRAQFVGECVSHLFRCEKFDVKKLAVREVDLLADHKSRCRVHQLICFWMCVPEQHPRAFAGCLCGTAYQPIPSSFRAMPVGFGAYQSASLTNMSPMPPCS